ncbi:MAG TPA: 4-hydroxybenzoate 3-monooxygenase [Rhodopila sp.]|uniref:4-hydroxybenzoate 3-monooxygenase n=1 Tax=Rhodopila sp. TaxID=2480087 RepID=UPI002BC9CDA5|nr:4-hydroxybenzoate 3-monooxygenase [Rhodopila sp.]HVY17644.1 4-hydroxybenzoate 3-monooxygenase [Rhodopila sp.]
MRAQVGIIGAGPAGLFLAHLLHRVGIESVILEARSRAEVEGTVRAGVLEHWVTDLMDELGLGTRMRREAHQHDGITLQWNGERHHVDIAGLTSGRHVTVYPQHEVLIDLIEARLKQGGAIVFGASAVSITGADGDTPRIEFRRGPDGALEPLHCDYVVAADGFHGPGRRAIPEAMRCEYQKLYPFGWLGILARAPLSWHELIYANQNAGFALCSTRSADVQRMYIQCDPVDDIANWSDDRIWGELCSRLACDGWTLKEGPIFQKGIIPLRSFVCETMQFGRLFLAGDAAHIVPPTGAKGLNLAVADVVVLARALEARFKSNRQDLLDGYASRALRRVWKAERFSWYMTTMLHRNDQESAFEHRIHLADLDLVRTNRSAAAALAENYVGLPFED